MKYLLSLGMAVALLFPLVTFAGDFTDIGGKEERSAIEYLQDQGVVQGYKDGTFRPTQNISRAEFLKILLETANIEIQKCTSTETEKAFSDIKGDDWFASIVCNARKSGVITGYADGTFKPHEPINFAEATKILTLSQGISLPKTESEHWYDSYITALQEEHAIRGEVSPSANITRGEMADMTWSIVSGHEIIPNGELPKIESCTALNKQLEKLDLRQGEYRYAEDMVMAPVSATSAPAATPAPASATSTEEKATGTGGGGSSPDYSSTNIQEYGVDEADIVKNDGSHIVIARNNEVRIVKAFPVNEMKEESKISLPNMWVQDLYLDGNRLIVIGAENSWNGDVMPMEKMIAPPYYGTSKLVAKVFDVTSWGSPKEIRSLTMEGYLVSSRKIGDILYLISNAYLPYGTVSETNLPKMLDSSTQTEPSAIAKDCAGITYIPNFSDRNLTLIAALDTENPQNAVTRTTLLGAGQNIYSSLENLFVTRQNSDQVYVDEGGNARWEWETVTDIFKFSLDGLNVAFAGSGTVPGYALNQYAMSEDNGYFRIATTKGEFWRGESTSGVYILDENLKKVSSVEGLAKGEKLYSARFMGKRGYLVTFKKIDPLFVIDLTPTNPKLLGELKVPGYSDYLHPYDENHLIGFGKDAIDAGEVSSDFAWYQGMKISMFDVTDLANPKELFSTKIGDRGTDSELLYNPKALFFDKSRNLLAFPVSVAKIPEASGTTAVNTYGETVFQGAYFYDIDFAKNAFTLIGTVTHFPAATKYFYDENYAISRVLRIGENFYTTAKGGVKALNSSLQEQKSVSFLQDIACTEIYNEQACRERTDCSPEMYMPPCPAGLACIQVMEFQRCLQR